MGFQGPPLFHSVIQKGIELACLDAEDECLHIVDGGLDHLFRIIAVHQVDSVAIASDMNAVAVARRE